jgi:uncharacterized protein (UPF0332 family)
MILDDGLDPEVHLMPSLTLVEGILRHLAASNQATIAAMAVSQSRHPYPLDEAIRQVTSDRLALAGGHLRAGDYLVQRSAFRASISRHYYAMYHASRAVVFAVTNGDDHQRHNVLARNLPATLPQRSTREQQLTDARLLRNEADYEPYPINEVSWAAEAHGLAATASEFMHALEEYALLNGHV